MNYLIAFVQLGILVPIYADYDLKCPTAGLWRLRAQSYCPHEENYTCLYYIDDDEQKYIESCEGPRKESPGDKTVNNSGNFENVDCSEDRYQPILFSTTKGSNCLYLKSNCNEEGQLIYSNGSTKQDRTCGCNYAEQYVFLSQNLSHPCDCRPSVEDCTCYKKACDSGFRLSPDYKCVPENETSGRYNCKEIKTLEKDKVVNLTKRGLEEENIEGRNRDLAIIYTVSLLLLVLFGVLLMVLFLKRIQLYYFYILCTTKDIFTSPLSDINDIDGEDVVLSCVVCKDELPLKWFRGDTEVIDDSDPRYKISSVGTRHEFTITGAQCGDNANYSVQFKDRKCSAIVNIQVPFTSPLPDIDIIEDDNIVLSCVVCMAGYPVKWFRDDTEIVAGNDPRYKISSVGTRHELTIAEAQCDDGGIYTVHFKDRKCSARVNIHVPFTSPLSDVDVIEDDNIVLSCVVCMDDVPVKWFRGESGDTEITSNSDPRYEISAVGTGHKLTITEAQCDDGGIYTVQFKDRKCSARVNIHVLFIDPLKETVCFEYDDIPFRCELCTDFSVEWYRYNKKINPGDNDRFIISSEGRVHTLTIKQVEYGDSGCYSVHFRHHICKANLIVLEEISNEANNFFKIFMLLITVVTPAVREIFDAEVPVDQLQDTLIKNEEMLESLKKKRVINLAEYDLLFPKTTHFTGKIVFTALKYTEGLGDKPRKSFEDLAGGMSKDISKLFAHCQGKQEVEILQFQPCVYVALNVTTENERELREMVSKKDIPPFTVLDVECTRLPHNNYRVDVILEYSDAFEDRNEQKEAEEKVAQLFRRDDLRVEKLEFWPNYLLAKFSLKTKDFHSKGRLSEVLQNAMTKGNQLPHKTTPILFPMKHEETIKHTPSSKNFDSRLMILLMKNLVYDNKRSNILPEMEDLLKIREFRNKIAHSTRNLTNDEFEEIWRGIEETLNRLSKGRPNKCMSKLKIKGLISKDTLLKLKQKFDKPQTILQENPEDGEVKKNGTYMSPVMSTEEATAVSYLINNFVDRAAREIFDKEYPPSSLKDALSKKKSNLNTLFNTKKITLSQWEQLFPQSGAVPSSENIDFSLRVRLIWDFKDTVKKKISTSFEDFQALSRLDIVTNGLRKFKYEEQEFEEIIKLLKAIGGEKYLHISTQGTNQDAVSP